MLTVLAKELFDALDGGSVYMQYIVQLVNEDSSILHESTADGKTPLYWAVEQHCYTGVLHFLLDHGADPNVCDNAGRTPLFLAVQLNYEDIVIALLNRGASADVMDDQQIHILEVAIRGSKANFNPKIWTALLYAGANPRLISRYHDAKLQPASMGVVALCSAINHGNTEFVRLLLDYGTNMAAKDTDTEQSSCYIGLRKTAYFLRTEKNPASAIYSSSVFRARLLEIMALSFAAAYMGSVELGRFHLGFWVHLSSVEQQSIKTYLYHTLRESVLEQAILKECVLQSAWHYHMPQDSILAARLFARCSDDQIIDLVAYNAEYDVGSVALYAKLLDSHPMRLTYDDSQLSGAYNTLFYIIHQYASQLDGIEALLEQIREDRKQAAAHAAFVTNQLFEAHIASNALHEQHEMSLVIQ